MTSAIQIDPDGHPLVVAAWKALAPIHRTNIEDFSTFEIFFGSEIQQGQVVKFRRSQGTTIGRLEGDDEFDVRRFFRGVGFEKTTTTYNPWSVFRGDYETLSCLKAAILSRIARMEMA